MNMELEKEKLGVNFDKLPNGFHIDIIFSNLKNDSVFVFYIFQTSSRWLPQEAFSQTYVDAHIALVSVVLSLGSYWNESQPISPNIVRMVELGLWEEWRE